MARAIHARGMCVHPRLVRHKPWVQAATLNMESCVFTIHPEPRTPEHLSGKSRPYVSHLPASHRVGRGRMGP